MAEKKKTTKTKKLHPGGSVPGFRPPPTPAMQKLSRRNQRMRTRLSNEIAKATGFKTGRQMTRAMQKMTPAERMAFERTHGQKIRTINDRFQAESEQRNAGLLKRVRRQQQRRAIKNAQKFLKQNPMMPTAGISQGRPVRGRTPMPGPVPNAEAMKRMQKLMREQQARFNKMQKARMARRPAPPFQTRPNVRSLDDYYMDKKTGRVVYLPNRRK